MATGLTVEPREALGTDIGCVENLCAALGAIRCLRSETIAIKRVVCIRVIGAGRVKPIVAIAIVFKLVVGWMVSCHGRSSLVSVSAYMPPLQSSMIALGTPCPAFELVDPRGFRMSNRDAHGRPLLVMFWCNHCPFVKHIADEVAQLCREKLAQGLSIAAISSNDPRTHPQDGPELMIREACQRGYVFPYLFDESQEVARAFDAQCTPDLFLFDAAHRLAYRGQLDDSRPSNGIPVTGRDLRAAIDAVLSGREPSPAQYPSVGCSIKWRARDG